MWEYSARGLTEEVTTDAASRTASQADVSALATSAEIAALNDFDPANDTVARVTLVDTTTANTDMRGTDGANTLAPDNASIAAILADTDELQGNQGGWATATGFATPADISAQTSAIKGADDRDLTEVYDNTPSVSIDPQDVADAMNLTPTSPTGSAGSVQDRLQTIEGGVGGDVNVISVGGSAVTGPDDFKADVSSLATSAQAVSIASQLTALQGSVDGLNDITAADVWGHATRGLTEPVDLQVATQAAVDLLAQLAQADQVYDEPAGLLHYYERGTTNDLIQPKTVSGTNVGETVEIRE